MTRHTNANRTVERDCAAGRAIGRSRLRGLVRVGLVAAMWCVGHTAWAQNFGYQSTVPDPGRYDPSHPVMDDLARAGVVGGVPYVDHVKAWLSPGDNIQAAINSGGPGVVHLAPGVYDIWEPLVLQDGVVLRGTSNENTWLSVHTTSNSKRFAVNFWEGTSYAGLEDLSISYDAHWADTNPQSFTNNPNGRNDLYVGGVGIWGDNNWLQSVRIYNTGTDPVLLAGDHNAVRNTYVRGAYNKGDGGHGYFDIRGDQNLVVWSNIGDLRHVAIQQGAQHNVLFDNYISGDINFHNGDDGQNLVERNTLYRPAWHPWQIFGTGGSQYGHAPPGYGNLLFKNDTWDQSSGSAPWSHGGTTFTFSGYGSPHASGWAYPDHDTYFAVKHIPWPWSAGHIGRGDNPGFISEHHGEWWVEAAGSDVWGQEDDFYYTWQQMHGDGQIVARLVSQEDTHEWAKAGLMFREFLEPGSKNAMVAVTPDHGLRFQQRDETYGDTEGMGLENFQGDDVWLALTREGDTLTGYAWADDRWIVVGSADVSMWEQAYVGFFATSHDAAEYGSVHFADIQLSSDIDIAAPVIGDLSGDGFVGVEDMDIVLANWGESVTPYTYRLGDWTGDGQVGQGDLDVVLANWGSGTPTGGNVPEPASALGLGGMLLMCMRRGVR